MSPTTDAAASHEVEAAETEAATKNLVFVAAERLFALHGFQNVGARHHRCSGREPSLGELSLRVQGRPAVRDLQAPHGRFPNRERAKMLHEANDRNGGTLPLREILAALLTPPCCWLAPIMSAASRCSP
ncbi:hypothetical protein ACRAWD_10885 [Caulobacter segnis]